MNHCASVCASVSYSASIRLSVPPSLSLFILKKKLSPNIEFVVAPGLKKKLNGEHGQAINLLFPFIWHTLYTCINFILLSPFNVLYLFLFFSIHFFPCLFHNPLLRSTGVCMKLFLPLCHFLRKKNLMQRKSFFTVAEETTKKEEISKEIVEAGRMLRKPTIFRACF